MVSGNGVLRWGSLEERIFPWDPFMKESSQTFTLHPNLFLSICFLFAIIWYLGKGFVNPFLLPSGVVQCRSFHPSTWIVSNLCPRLISIFGPRPWHGGWGVWPRCFWIASKDPKECCLYSALCLGWTFFRLAHRTRTRTHTHILTRSNMQRAPLPISFTNSGPHLAWSNHMWLHLQ